MGDRSDEGEIEYITRDDVNIAILREMERINFRELAASVQPTSSAEKIAHDLISEHFDRDDMGQLRTAIASALTAETDRQREADAQFLEQQALNARQLRDSYRRSTDANEVAYAEQVDCAQDLLDRAAARIRNAK